MTIAEYLEQKGREEGLQEGVQKGERGAALKIAHAMLADGLELARVMKLTGLSEEELAQIHH
jgi:predicted transposase/invertase (TIGR01784 family)